MNFVDKTITCVDCSAPFTHSAADQQRYSERGFTNEPKRCPDCRAKRKAEQSFGGGGGGGAGGRRGGSAGGGGGGGYGRERGERFTTTCSACGRSTEVPFKPTEGRPVYCRDCFQQRRR